MIDNKSLFSPALSAFRVWQALEPLKVVEEVPIADAFAQIQMETAAGSEAMAGILRSQAVSLNILCTRLLEFAADAQDDWPKYSGLVDLALRAQEQCRKAIESAGHSGGEPNGQP